MFIVVVVISRSQPGQPLDGQKHGRDSALPLSSRLDELMLMLSLMRGVSSFLKLRDVLLGV